MPNNHNEREKRLWESADKLRANSNLKPSEYSVPVLGLIFLLYADMRFAAAERELWKQTADSRKHIKYWTLWWYLMFGGYENG